MNKKREGCIEIILIFLFIIALLLGKVFVMKLMVEEATKAQQQVEKQKDPTIVVEDTTIDKAMKTVIESVKHD